MAKSGKKLELGGKYAKFSWWNEVNKKEPNMSIVKKQIKSFLKIIETGYYENFREEIDAFTKVVVPFNSELKDEYEEMFFKILDHIKKNPERTVWIK